VLTGAVASGLPPILPAVASLAAVILLILLVARGARLLPALQQQGGAPGLLTLRGSLALDTRRRLHLVEADGRLALVLTGGTSDVVIGLPHAGP
jgi:hypothetical protein